MKIDILGVKIDNLKESEVISVLGQKIEENEKFWLVTPNAEFIVAASQDQEFKRLLNQADLALPDGFGLILASRLRQTKPLLKERVSGADVVEEILKLAPQKGWRIGVVEARRGVEEEAAELIKRLSQKYKGLKIESFDQRGEETKVFDIIFACQGMKEQEKWIWENRPKIKAKIFMGIGGSLDFLAGFSQRAPRWLRKIGLEWLWRLILEPWRWRRQINLLKFVLLILKERF